MKISIAAVSSLLQGSQYPLEVDPNLMKDIIESRIVIVFGHSDDVMEFDGAITDEVYAYNGGIAYLDEHGLIINKCNEYECPYFLEKQKNSATIEAIYNVDGYFWKYKTGIYHETFDILKGKNKYCQGIVFNLAQIKKE